jgi:hypothetical protein
LPGNHPSGHAGHGGRQWSSVFLGAIFNGYDPGEMAKCPFAGIRAYLNKEPKETLQIQGARVTHIWTDDPSDAVKVARASLIPHVVQRPEDVIGQVDAVIVATD